jgi:hypothetical protein
MRDLDISVDVSVLLKNWYSQAVCTGALPSSCTLRVVRKAFVSRAKSERSPSYGRGNESADNFDHIFYFSSRVLLAAIVLLAAAVPQALVQVA